MQKDGNLGILTYFLHLDSRSATDILFYLILLNYIVPISLYVSIEFQVRSFRQREPLTM